MTSRGSGYLFALLAFGSWGLVPLYWRLLSAVPPLEVLAHRVVWSVAVVGGLLAALGGARAAWSALKAPRTALLLFVSASLIATNWGLFIYAVASNQLADASLGYFVNPLANVVLGVVVLKERLSPAQRVSVGLAAAAALVLVLSGGALPWLALALTASFAVYGLIRKLAPLESTPGLFAECVLLCPVAIAGIAWFEQPGGVLTRGDAAEIALVALAGPVTALPLVWFTAAARKLPLSTLGLFQYLAPSLQLVLAVSVMGESVSPARWLAFALIWVALAIYTGDLLRR